MMVVQPVTKSESNRVILGSKSDPKNISSNNDKRA
jgi:hypothetical protein